MTGMANINDRRLADYAERLRRLYNTVRPLLTTDQQDELLELAVGVGLLVTAGSGDSSACLCGHPQARHRADPVLCLDCWHTPSAQPDSRNHEHLFQPNTGARHV